MIGYFSKTTDSSFIEASGYAGFDFVILDQEHGPVSRERLYNHIRAAKVGQLKSYVRVQELNHNAIGSALDAGADGVQIPNISTLEQAREAIKAAKFSPSGERGVCRFVKSAQYGNISKVQYFKSANQKKLILQVEGLEGVANIDKILQLDGFDVLFIGPYDLSQSLGLIGQTEHPKVINLIREISVKVKKSGKLLGAFSDNLDNAKMLKSIGVEYLAYSVDVNLFLEQCKSVVQNLK